MKKMVYVNGSYVEDYAASISVFDRGFLFADGVYEVTTVLQGKMVDNAMHLARLKRSLNELGMQCPVSFDALAEIQTELVRLNELKEGVIYLQITRGSENDRDFNFSSDLTPSLVIFTQAKSLLDNPKAKTGISVVTMPDLRWKRCDIKTIGLLYPAMAKHEAVHQGADDAWLVQDGLVTEGTSNNAMIITRDNKLVTRHLGNEILSGITRSVVMELSASQRIQVEERSFSVLEAIESKEAFVTSASLFVMPVVSIDGHQINNGKPGDLTLQLRDSYIRRAIECSD